MTLTIDKQKIDFTLEDEKNLKQVIQNINIWLNENQLIIEKLFINSEDFSLHDLDFDLSNVKSIDIETLSFTELNINNLSWIKYFFERLIKALEEWNNTDLNTIKEEIPFVIENLPIILSLDNKTPEKSYAYNLKKIFDKYNYFQTNEENINKDEVISYFNIIVSQLTERLHEYINAKRELKSGINQLLELQKELDSVAVYLQTGKSDEAALIMKSFTDIFHKILRILKFNIKNTEFTNGKDIEDFTNGLDDILSELLEGFENQDTVLIGDILEYELSPKIEILQEIFS